MPFTGKALVPNKDSYTTLNPTEETSVALDPTEENTVTLKPTEETTINTASSIRFLTIADWGGKNVEPYSSASQNHTAQGMAIVAAEIESQFVLALGDNFYLYGISTDVNDPRFAQTWHSVYTGESLQIPWYVCAGNHDHRGNVTAQIAYTAISEFWEFPSLYHNHSFTSEDGSVTVDVILIDTSTYTGVNSGSVYPAEVADGVQHAWIENQLSSSTADHIIVAGHYSVYSSCSHGNTETLIVNLVPLLSMYGAHYMGGHDHCAQHVVIPGASTSYWLNGMGVGCCYHYHENDDIPTDGLQYVMANFGSESIDDDGIEVGINGTIGGFSSVIATSDSMTVLFHNQNGTVLYTSSVPARDVSLLLVVAEDFGIDGAGSLLSGLLSNPVLGASLSTDSSASTFIFFSIGVAALVLVAAYTIFS